MGTENAHLHEEVAFGVGQGTYRPLEAQGKNLYPVSDFDLLWGNGLAWPFGLHSQLVVGFLQLIAQLCPLRFQLFIVSGGGSQLIDLADGLIRGLLCLPQDPLGFLRSLSQLPGLLPGGQILIHGDSSLVMILSAPCHGLCSVRTHGENLMLAYPTPEFLFGMGGNFLHCGGKGLTGGAAGALGAGEQAAAEVGFRGRRV